MKSLIELDEPTRELLLTHLSINLNWIIATKVKDFSKYEMKRYHYHGETSAVIAEFSCAQCKMTREYEAINVKSYIRYRFTKSDHLMQDTLNSLDCKNCNLKKFELSEAV